MDMHIMKITICGVYMYIIQNSTMLQTEAGGNTEEIEVNTDREEGWEQGEKERGEEQGKVKLDI